MGPKVVDLGGATLMPGLIDTHVHLVFDSSVDPVGRLAARTDEQALAAADRLSGPHALEDSIMNSHYRWVIVAAGAFMGCVLLGVLTLFGIGPLLLSIGGLFDSFFDFRHFKRKDDSHESHID